MNLPDKVKEKLRTLPDKPGCYLMRDRHGAIIYVGKAASLRQRVGSYFRQATLRSASPKLRGLVRSICDFDCLVLRNEAEALLTEGRLIKDYRPRYNVSFKDDKRFLLLRAAAQQPFPKFMLCRIRREDGARYFGPYASSAAARATLDFIEKRFGLRKCEPRVPDRETYRHCINDIVRYCSAPCIGKVSPEEYLARFDEACAFLRGERSDILDEVRGQMQEAASRCEFERAAALRDTLFRLQEVVRQRARVSSTPEMKAADARVGVSELREVLGLERVPHCIEGYDVSNISGTHSVASMVCFVDGMPQRSRYRRFRIRTLTGANDPGMMAEVIHRRFDRLRREGGELPDLVLVDGGAAQLGVARAELSRLELTRVPVAALAKRFEEIYWSEDGQPVRLSADSAALKVLQRLRDEAHRFALTYHRYLRDARLRESALDEIPGIGCRKKQALLRRFGSVRRLARASEARIAETPGIGARLAAAILAELKPAGAGVGS